MPNPDELIAILDRILNGSRDESEVAKLRQWLKVSGTTLQFVSQDGKFNTNIGQVLQGEIHIGDRIYQGPDAEAIRDVIRCALKEYSDRVHEIGWNREIPLTLQEYRNRQILLNKVKQYWVKEGIETSVHGRALIALGLENRPDEVDRHRPWSMVWKLPDQPSQLLPKSTRVFEKFDEMGPGRTLLILGEPGAGKTTTLLELARDLIERAEKNVNQPIPVVFNLSSWTRKKQTIAEWLIWELKIMYGFAPKIGRDWVDAQHLLLLLDGLDEVSVDFRESCVLALNRFIQKYGQTEIVVCSRIKDYKILTNRLKLQASIYLQPLTLEQIHQYLTNAGSELAAIKTVLQVDTTLQEIVKSPLMLDIMIVAYQGKTIENLSSINSIEKRHHDLFDKYIQRMLDYHPSNQLFQKNKTMKWLIWLAQRMSQQSESFFIINQMQPNLLQTQFQKKSYAVGVILIDGLVVGQILGMFFVFLSLIIEVFYGTVSYRLILDGIIFGLVLGLVFWVYIGIMDGMFSGLYPYFAWVQHLILRLVLYYDGYIPWNYDRFLNFATQQIILQKVGRGYKFIHRLLQEHIAAVDIDTYKN